MKRVIAAALLASTMLAGLSASASAQPAASEAATSRTMDAAYIAVPVVRSGQLVNYIFVSLRVDVSPAVDLWRTRERAHFLRDALIRAAHASDLASPARDDQLNTPVALAAFRAAAAQALGANAVRNITIVATNSTRRTTQASR